MPECHSRCIDTCFITKRRECGRPSPRISYIHPRRLKRGQEVSLGEVKAK